MNPAALKTNVGALKPGGLIIADRASSARATSPRPATRSTRSRTAASPSGSCSAFDISQLTLECGEAVRPRQQGSAALQEHVDAGPGALDVRPRPRSRSIDWLKAKFAKEPGARRGQHRRAQRRPCLWRDGRDRRAAQAACMSIAAPRRAGPLPHRHRRRGGLLRPRRGRAAGRPADVLRRLSDHAGLRDPAPSRRGSRNSASPPSRRRTRSPRSARAIGASYAGQLGVTSSSGPGIALKSEAMGLAIMTELPLVIVNSQRGGPSTGLPTKTEQSDLYQAVYGRNGDAPMPVIAARSPADAFECAIEAVRIAVQYMTPVMLLTDGYIANAAEPWKVPDMTATRRSRSSSSTRADRRRRASCPTRATTSWRASVDQAGHARPDAPHRRHREERSTPAISTIRRPTTRR